MGATDKGTPGLYSAGSYQVASGVSGAGNAAPRPQGNGDMLVTEDMAEWRTHGRTEVTCWEQQNMHEKSPRAPLATGDKPTVVEVTASLRNSK